MPRTLLFLLFLASFTPFVMAGTRCQTEVSIPGMALDGFVFKVISVTAPYQCDIHCEGEVKCQSYNYVIGEKICELNNRTKEARPQNFRSDPVRFYMRRFVGRAPLGSIPELPAVSCLEIQASEGKYTISSKYWLETNCTRKVQLVGCSDSVKGINCSDPKPVDHNKDDEAAPTVLSPDRGNGQPQDANDYDFELVFRETQQTSYVKHDMKKVWVGHFTVCAWIHTPDIKQNQHMTVISILTEESDGDENILSVKIDGRGKIYFSIDDDQTAVSDVFATSSPKDRFVFLCMRIKPGQSHYIEAIVDADFGSKKSSDDVEYENVKWNQVIIGQNQDDDGTIKNDYPFYGRISNLNIWNNSLTDDHIRNWFNSSQKVNKPNILKWPELGSSSKRFGDVHFVKVSSAEREWRNVSDGEVDVQNTTGVVATKSVESGSRVVIEVESQSPVSCIGSDGIDSATVDGVFISVSRTWERTRYKQTFLETQKCFAIFGSVPTWATGIFTPGVSEFDLSLDELWKEEYLGSNGTHFDGVNALCGDEHFWMINHPSTPVAGVSLRRKSRGSSAGISTFGKCGKFKFKISDIRVLE